MTNPALFWTGLGLVAVPILIHLFFRRRHRVVRWAAIDFLLAALKKQKRRMQFENFLLLLLRCLAILLVALALARPTVRAAAVTPFLAGARHVVVLLDTSASMEARHTARRAFDRAREEASELLERLPGSSRVTLLVTRDELAGGVPRALVESATPGEVRTRLAALQPGHGPNRLADALRLAGRKLEEMGHGQPGEVFYFTDLQRSDWLDPETGRREDVYRALRGLRAAEDARVHVAVVDVGTERLGNVTILDLSKEEGREAFAGFLLGVSVTLANYGSEPVDGTLSLYMAHEEDGRWEKKAAEKLRLKASLQAGPAATVVKEVLLPLPPDRAGPARFRAAFEAEGENDRLAADSERLLAARVRPPVRFLPVQTVRDALSIQRDVEQSAPVIDLGEPVPPEALSTLDLSAYDAVVWADAEVLGLDESGAKNLEEFVRRGGGLLAYLGAYAQPDKVNRLLYRADGDGVLPMRLAAGPPVTLDRESPTAFDLDEPIEHPLFRDYTATEQLRRLFPSPRIHLYRPVADVPEGSVVARYATGDPAVLEHRLGRGRVVVVTTTPDERGFELAGSLVPSFLFFDAAHYLVSEDARDRNVPVGSPVHVALPPRAHRVLVRPPEEAGGRLEHPVPEDQRVLAFRETYVPGFYAFEVKTTPAPGASLAHDELFLAAVNLDPAEGDLRRIPGSELERAFPAVDLRVQGAGSELEPAAEEAGPEGELSRALLAAVVALLFAELLFAWRFGSRRRAAA